MERSFTISEETNFVRIFRLPLSYPRGFCFGGGYPVNFQLVDCFNPFSTQEIYGSTHKIIGGDEYENHIDHLRDFIGKKVYFERGSRYLAIADYGDAFLIADNPATT
jgi:hypothetical protein